MRGSHVKFIWHPFIPIGCYGPCVWHADASLPCHFADWHAAARGFLDGTSDSAEWRKGSPAEKTTEAREWTQSVVEMMGCEMTMPSSLWAHRGSKWHWSSVPLRARKRQDTI